MIDGFCGMGGVSDGYALEGFDVTGIDIVDAPTKLGYKHRFIQADILTLNGADFRGYDVIWGSPPCRDFSNFTAIGWKFWKDKPNPERGLSLVKGYLDFVTKANPTIYVMENVPRLQKYLHREPRQVSRIGKTMRRAFWGDYPDFLMPCDTSKPSIYYHNWKRETRAWDRAKIPLACSRAFARACKDKLVEATP